MIIPELQHLAVDVDSLTELPGNPRRGDVDAVAASLARFGQRKPVIVRASDRTITAGNHTWKAARQLGWTTIAALVLDDDEATSAAFALADNRTSELGSYDEADLLALIRTVGDLDPSMLADAGWSEDAVRELVDRIDPALPDEPPGDDAPAPPAEPISRPGDVWVLGGHRLVCGDATDVGAYDALLGSEKVSCVWTDPPYGVAYVGKTADALTIENDNLSEDDLRDFVRAAFGAALAATKGGACWYVASPARPLHLVFGEVLHEAGVLRQTLIWVKDSMVLGRSDYHYKHEPIYYGWTPGAAHDWLGDRTQTSVIEVARPTRSTEHPTMKPVDLIVRCLNNSAPRGGLVLDPFGGSGSTLMACEYTGRRARLIELDPRYVDVIARRWQEFTGAKPLLEATGEPHDFTVEAAS